MSSLFGINFHKFDNFFELCLNLIQGLDGKESADVDFIFLYTHSINEMIFDIVHEWNLIIRFCDNLKWMLIVLAGQVETDDVETIIEESW